MGFHARVPVAEGIRRTVAWTRENLSRIEATVEKHAARMAVAPGG